MNIYTEIPAYVYKHTNKQTKEFYFGSRCYNVRLNVMPEIDFPKYVCSSEIKKLIIENVDEWESEIIETFYGENKKEDCFWYEQELIKQFWGNPLLLNKQYKDFEKGSKVFLSNGVCSEFTKEKISLKNKGSKRSDEAKLKMSIAKIGKKRSEAVKKQMSETRKGRTHRQESKDKVRDSKLGKPRDQETKDKISKTLTGKPRYETLKECYICGRKMRGSNLVYHLPKCIRNNGV
jgi:hypothetical protein